MSVATVTRYVLLADPFAGPFGSATEAVVYAEEYGLAGGWRLGNFTREHRCRLCDAKERLLYLDEVGPGGALPLHTCRPCGDADTESWRYGQIGTEV